MEQQGYMLPEELNFQTFNDVMPPESSIKREDLKDEYDIFLFSHLDNISNNITTSNELSFNPQVDLSQKTDHLTTDLSGIENKVNVNDKENLTLKTEMALNSNNPSHLVRYRIQDGKQVKIWECGICQKVFTHQYTLTRHLPTHTDERKFQCITCGKAFRQMSTLSQHRAIHSTERPYVCEICQKTFNRISTLISHRKTHTGLKSHRCHLCTKAFHQKGNLRNHIFTHTNERPYKCDICGNGFNQMSNLMCHKLKAHQKTEKPKYICHVCGKEFPKRVGLRQHEQLTHKILSPTPVVSPQIIDKINYSNAIIVDPIKTEAMKHAIESNQTPFALLRPVMGIPVLVRVLPAGDKQMLVPASAQDLKKHSHISVMAKGEKRSIDGKQVGSTVQIKIPVVATVIQRKDHAGQMSMSVVSPGPSEDVNDQIGLVGSKLNNFVYSSTIPVNSDPLFSGETSTNLENMSHAFNKDEPFQVNNSQFLEEGRRIDDLKFNSTLQVDTNGMVYKDGNVLVTATSTETSRNEPSSSDSNFSNTLFNLPLL